MGRRSPGLGKRVGWASRLGGRSGWEGRGHGLASLLTLTNGVKEKTRLGSIFSGFASEVLVTSDRGKHDQISNFHRINEIYQRLKLTRRRGREKGIWTSRGSLLVACGDPGNADTDALPGHTLDLTPGFMSLTRRYWRSRATPRGLIWVYSGLAPLPFSAFILRFSWSTVPIQRLKR